MAIKVELTPLGAQALGLMKDPEKERQKQLAALLPPLAQDPQAAAQTVRTPEYQQAMIGAGMGPDQVLSLYRNLPLQQQKEAADLLNDLEVRHIQGEDIGEQGMELLYSFGKLNRPKEPDPLADAERKYLADPTRAAEAVRRKYEGPPKPIDPVAETESELLQDPETRKRVARIRLGLEPKATGGGGQEQPLPAGQALNEVQERAEREKKQLEGELYETIDTNSPSGMAKWEALPEDQRAKYSENIQYPGYYYKLRDTAPENKVGRLKEVNKYLLDFEAQKRGADSLQTILAQPPASAAPQAASQQTYGPPPPRRVKDAFGDPSAVFQAVVSGPVDEMMRADKAEEAQEMVKQYMQELSTPENRQKFAELWGIDVASVEEMLSVMQGWFNPVESQGE